VNRRPFWTKLPRKEPSASSQHRDEHSFMLHPEPKKESSFDGVTGVETDLTETDVAEMVRECQGL